MIHFKIQLSGPTLTTFILYEAQKIVTNAETRHNSFYPTMKIIDLKNNVRKRYIKDIELSS